MRLVDFPLRLLLQPEGWHVVCFDLFLRRLLCYSCPLFSVQDGFTPLYIAAQNGHAEVAAVLLDMRADVNAPNKVRGECRLLFAGALCNA